MENEDARRAEIIRKGAEKIRQSNLMSDTFASIALEDVGACQYVLRILLGIEDLKVVEVKGQYRLLNMTSKDAILDIFAEDSTGRLMNIEIQRRDTVDHGRRTRYYGVLLDKSSLDKGKEYSELPDVYIIYISEKDLWNVGEPIYEVKKTLGKRGVPYDDGSHVIFVNTEVNDGSAVAKLMEYFKTADPEDARFGELSERVRFLKKENGGYEDMCNVAKELIEQGMEMGIEKGVEKGMEKGMEKGKVEGAQNATVANIKNLMANLKWTAEQAMAALGIPAAKQSEYLALLN